MCSVEGNSDSSTYVDPSNERVTNHLGGQRWSLISIHGDVVDDTFWCAGLKVGQLWFVFFKFIRHHL